ncbi:MAG TPA: alpha/beta hydrolase [Novosphingobium sp.]|nr:alpha/beta hydrolase [Novosphingobium sp.]
MPASPRPSTRHLVAPELDGLIDLFPAVDFSQGIAALRAAGIGRAAPPLPDALAAIPCTERFLPVGGGHPDVRVLHYEPARGAQGPRPALLHLHGGGFVLGNPDMNDASNRRWVAETGCVVVSVDYRLAPETTWQGALADNAAALAWLHGKAGELGVDRKRIAVAGESAGGGHAAMLSQHARALGTLPICFLLLDAPMLDDRTCTHPDPHPYTGEFVWTAEKNRFGWASLLGMEPGGDSVPSEAVPARATDLAGLPPTFISVGALDLFLEENLDYARRLTRAGVPVELHVVPGAYHGAGMAADAPLNRQTASLRLAALKRAFAL